MIPSCQMTQVDGDGPVVKSDLLNRDLNRSFLKQRLEQVIPETET